MVALAERLGLDRNAVGVMQRLRRKYGGGPLMLRLATHSRAVLLSPPHVHRVLDGAPEPFSPASFEKRAALAHFEPKNVLISDSAERPVRRQFHEEVLESHRHAHALAPQFLRVVDEEADAILRASRRAGSILDWTIFFSGWYRVVRRVVFGDAARDDHGVTDDLAALRARGNWAFVPQRRRVRARFLSRVRAHLDRAEPGSLAEVVARRGASEAEAPVHQIPQWLFAFDPAGMTTFRALGLLATHPDAAEQAREEFAGPSAASRLKLPFLRATVLEALRLWPTTPLLLRQSTRDTQWGNDTMPSGTAVVIFAPYFHRDNEQWSFANWFTPGIWREPDATRRWPLVPFSGGPAQCPGQQLVLLLTSNMLGRLVSEHLRITDPTRLDSRSPLPGTLDNYSLAFAAP